MAAVAFGLHWNRRRSAVDILAMAYSGGTGVALPAPAVGCQTGALRFTNLRGADSRWQPRILHLVDDVQSSGRFLPVADVGGNFANGAGLL